MGSMASLPRRASEVIIRSREIDKELLIEKRSKKVKLLLLGTSECGKSTILKQMRILHDQGFSKHERKVMRFVVNMNIVKSISALVQAADNFGYEFSNPDSARHANLVCGVLEEKREYEPISEILEQSLKVLWADQAIQLCYERRNEFHLVDSAKYFLDEIERIAKPDYIPNEQDMLYLRMPTCGVVEVTFKVKDTLFRVVDVGGQRSQRRKWIHVFDDVNSIIFMTAINEFDQVLQEDNKTNRIVESLELFEEICNKNYFTVKVSLILFLNKTDLFKEKLQKSSIRVAFPEYTGSQDYEESISFIEKQFLKVNENPAKKIYPHQTCATNTDQVQLVLNSVIDTIHAINNKNAGFA